MQREPMRIWTDGFSLTRPSPARIQAFLDRQRNAPFSYREQGATRGPTPAGYASGLHRIRLGHGAAAFARAVAALEQWKMFDTGWTALYPPNPPIHTGSAVALLVEHYGFWSLHACRIVYVVDQRGPHSECGFAYGTLPAHAERGEERFTVELDPEDQGVWYKIRAFSRPRGLARAASPLARRLQKRFAADSQQAMLRATGDSS